MKCIVCGKSTSEFSDGYCLRCEKLAVDVDIELSGRFGQDGNGV